MFCKLHGTHDSIEHLCKCIVIQGILPSKFLDISPDLLSKYFFLLEGSEQVKIQLACFIASVYFAHNHLRHSSCRAEIKQQIQRALMDKGLSKKVSQAWNNFWANL